MGPAGVSTAQSQGPQEENNLNKLPFAINNSFRENSRTMQLNKRRRENKNYHHVQSMAIMEPIILGPDCDNKSPCAEITVVVVAGAVSGNAFAPHG